MDQISILAAGGMRARLEALDVVANNLANSSTNGYKSDGEFYSVFASELASDDGSGPTAVPTLDQQWTNFAPGLLEPTNNPLDMGISGKGFFVVQGPSGPLYTRNGSFHFGTDGQLLTSDGYPLLQDNGKPFQADPTKRLEVSHDGTINQGGNSIGRIKLAEFSETSALSKRGDNYFWNNSLQEPGDAAGAEVLQGKVEASNVSAAQGAVRIVGLTRQFEMMQKAIIVSNEMGKQAIEQVAKVS